MIMRKGMTIKCALLIASAAILAAGCGKEDAFGGKYSRKAGDPVVFGVGTAQELGTRVEYRAGTYTDGQLQPIDWKAGDMIRVYSPDASRDFVAGGVEHWADYTVNPKSDDKSLGTLSNVQPNGLAWGDAGNHTFYGFYPSPKTDEADVPAGASGKFSYTIPAAQTADVQMEYAYMTAYASASNNKVSGDAVRLDFYAGFTTFELDLTASEPLTVHSFELSSNSMKVAGPCTIQYNNAGTPVCTPATDASDKVTVDFGTTGKTVAENANFKIVVFALPLDLTGMKIKFTVSTPNSTNPARTNSLELKYADTAKTGTPGEYVTFGARKYHKLKGLVTPHSTKLIQVNSQIVDWVSKGQTSVDVIPQ